MNLDFGELRKSVPSVHVANGALGYDVDNYHNNVSEND